MKKDYQRLTNHQQLTKKFPVLSMEGVPEFNRKKWRLKVDGLVEESFELTYEEVQNLPKISITKDFHCITGWTKENTKWQGVSIKTLAEKAQISPETTHVSFYCMSPYSTALTFEEAFDETVLLAYSFEDKPMEPEHGFPLRLVVPKKWAYKSAKWVNHVRFLDKLEPGYWESRGYTQDAEIDPEAIEEIEKQKK